MNKFPSGPIFPDWWPYCQSLVRHLGPMGRLFAPAKLDEWNWPCQRWVSFWIVQAQVWKIFFEQTYITTACRISMLLGDAQHCVGDLRFKTTVAAAPQILLPHGFMTEMGAA